MKAGELLSSGDFVRIIGKPQVYLVQRFTHNNLSLEPLVICQPAPVMTELEVYPYSYLEKMTGEQVQAFWGGTCRRQENYGPPQPDRRIINHAALNQMIQAAQIIRTNQVQMANNLKGWPTSAIEQCDQAWIRINRIHKDATLSEVMEQAGGTPK